MQSARDRQQTVQNAPIATLNKMVKKVEKFNDMVHRRSVKDPRLMDLYLAQISPTPENGSKRNDRTASEQSLKPSISIQVNGNVVLDDSNAIYQFPILNEPETAYDTKRRV